MTLSSWESHSHPPNDSAENLAASGLQIENSACRYRAHRADDIQGAEILVDFDFDEHCRMRIAGIAVLFDFCFPKVTRSTKRRKPIDSIQAELDGLQASSTVPRKTFCG